MGKRMRVRLIVVVACIALAAVWGFPAIPGTALADSPHSPPGKDKGGGGDGNTSLRLTRISCAEWSRIQWDGKAECVDPTHPDDLPWQYWDQRDTPMAEQWPAEYGVQTGVSGGGRLFFFTATNDYKVSEPSVRWIVLDFPTPPGGDDGNGPNIDADLYSYDEGIKRPATAPGINPSTYVDNVKSIIKLDGMFKKTVTRQPLEVAIRGVRPDGSWALSGWSLHSVEDLYVVQDADDQDVRTLTTVNPDTHESDVDWFVLRYDGVEIAQYRLPLEWKMRIVTSP